MSFKDPSDLPKLGADYKLRNIDSAARAEFLKLFLWLFCPLSLIGFLLDGITGVALIGAASLVLALIGKVFSERAGNVGTRLLLGGRQESLREQLEAEFQKANYYKRQKQFDRALAVVEGILGHETVFAEALYLKALILWEGFGDTSAAHACLTRILEMESVEDDKFRQCAIRLSDELSESKKSLYAEEGSRIEP